MAKNTFFEYENLGSSAVRLQISIATILYIAGPSYVVLFIYMTEGGWWVGSEILNPFQNLLEAEFNSEFYSLYVLSSIGGIPDHCEDHKFLLMFSLS